MFNVGRLFQKPSVGASYTTSFVWRLPTELILQIVDQMDNNDRVSLLVTCRQMKAIVEVTLYTNLIIPPSRRRNIDRLLRTYKTRPELAKRMKSFSGYLGPLLDTNPGSRYRPGEFLGATFDGTPSNLTSLYLYDHDWLWSSAFSQLRGMVCYLKLTSLKIRGSRLRSFQRATPDATQLVVMLRCQPRLKELELLSGPWDVTSLLKSDIPELRTLEAGPEDARTIVPGRPIRSLKLRLSKGLDEDTWKALGMSTVGVRDLTLDLILGSGLAAAIASAATYLGGVEQLGLRGVPISEIESNVSIS